MKHLHTPPKTLAAAKVGFALTGSFCTFSKAFAAMEAIKATGADVTAIFSAAASDTDTRFGTAADWILRAETITGKPVIRSIREAEPIGPQGLTDLLIVAPVTGNTLAKLASGITDTSVTMAVKSHLRNAKPCLMAVSTNDGLGASAVSIGKLLARKHVYFVPYGQDDPEKKPNSLVSDFTQLPLAAAAALQGKQRQPLLVTY